jgi:hypothetical protein
VAAYFAVEEEYSDDSVVYVYKGQETVDLDKEKSPFQVKQVMRYRPPHLSPRIVAQGGLFTVHPNPADNLLDSSEVSKLIISKDAKREMKKILYKYGISRKTLFPGLDGLCADLDWLHTDRY